jgi:nucleotide-binding universal stress UspA family protein
MCPIDFSDYSQRALRYAALLVRRLEAQLTVLHVNEPLLVATDTVVYARRPEEETRAELRHFVDEALAGDEFHLPEVAILVAEGHPAEEIVKAADENGVDLIVMGSHGLSGYRKIFIGSTTERVLRRTFIPVAAVPLAESTFSLENALRPDAGPVLAAVDFTNRRVMLLAWSLTSPMNWASGCSCCTSSSHCGPSSNGASKRPHPTKPESRKRVSGSRSSPRLLRRLRLWS